MDAPTSFDPVHFFVLRFEGNKRSRTSTFLSSHRDYLPAVRIVEIPTLNDIRQAVRVIKSLPKSFPVLISSPNSLLVVLLLVLRKPRPILDAGWPLIDGVISSRRQFGVFGLNLIKTYLIDFIAFHYSRLVFLESVEQIKFVQRTFLVPQRKLSLLFTGFDEGRVLSDTHNEAVSVKPVKPYSVLFRGGDQSEAGLQTLKEAMLILPKESETRFIVISKGFLNSENSIGNLKVIDKELTDIELFKEIRFCDVMLGQMSSHSRLKRTIPHKFFEAAFFCKPYVTSNTGVMEFFVKNQMVFGFKGGDPKSLAEVLNAALSDPEEMKRRASRLHGWYLENASQRILMSKFKTEIEKLWF